MARGRDTKNVHSGIVRKASEKAAPIHTLAHHMHVSPFANSFVPVGTFATEYLTPTA